MMFSPKKFNCFQIRGCIVLTIRLLFLASVHGLQNEEQRQVFTRPDLPTHYRTHHGLTFKVLQQDSKCSDTNLTTCHTDSFLHEIYHYKCYEKACPKSKYFCLNDPNSNSLHLCGTLNPWEKRHRYIVVRDKTVSDFVHVYSIDCPLGFFKSNEKNPFTKCDEDESITIVKNGTDRRNALARCNLKKNYCNREGVTLFELGSEKDNCLHAKYDLNISCDETEDLLPNCKCVPKCMTFEEREWSGNFTCIPKTENVTNPEKTKQGGERITQVTKPYRTSTEQSIPPVGEQDDTDSTNQDEELSVVENESQNRDNNDNNSVTINGLEIIGIILAVAFVIGGVLFVVKHIARKTRNYNTVSQGDTVDETESGQVKKISSTKIKKTTYHVHTNNATFTFNQEDQGKQNLKIQNASNSTDIEACLESMEIGPAPILPQMQNMKELEMPQTDSGIHTTNQTYE